MKYRRPIPAVEAPSAARTYVPELKYPKLPLIAATINITHNYVITIISLISQ